MNEFGQPIGFPVEGWFERRQPARLPLQGRYCRLEPVAVNHADDLHEAYMEAPDGRDWTYLFVERPATTRAFRDYLDRLIESRDPLHFAVVDAASGKALGTAALMRMDLQHGTIEVGSIVFSPRLKRSRIATESMYLLMRSAFDELKFRRYEWKCDSLNAPSRSAAERHGFTFEGIFRSAIVYKNRNRDTAWYSVIAEEWPRVRQAFETWLEPDNFDAAGRQKRGLAAIRAAISGPVRESGANPR